MNRRIFGGSASPPAGDSAQQDITAKPTSPLVTPPTTLLDFPCAERIVFANAGQSGLKPREHMIELILVPWSPYCLVQQRILEFAGAPHKLTVIPPNDRSLVWKLSRQRYYQVPILRDGRAVIFETDDNSQVISKYLESKLNLDLFPKQWDGLQRIVWRYIENDIEAVTFKLNDAYFRQFVAPADQLAYIRHKERKFGRGCLDQWRACHKQLQAELSTLLLPFEQMLGTRPFLLDARPRFVDFDLWGMLGNFLFSGRYSLPPIHPKLRMWHRRMSRLKLSDTTK